VIACANRVYTTYVQFRVLSTDVHPHASVKCGVETLYYGRHGVAGRGEMIDTFLLKMPADILIETFLDLSVRSSEVLLVLLIKQLPKCHCDIPSELKTRSYCPRRSPQHIDAGKKAIAAIIFCRKALHISAYHC
jgi:hypothetical protein